MRHFDVVIDTNVVYSALYSNRGASFRLLSEVGVNARFLSHISVPLMLEYEEVLKRNSRTLRLTHQDVDDVLDYLCSVARPHQVFYLWRPFLPDNDDDMVLELAVAASCDRIITHNTKDFAGSETLGVSTVTPRQFLGEIGVI